MSEILSRDLFLFIPLLLWISSFCVVFFLYVVIISGKFHFRISHIHSFSQSASQSHMHNILLYVYTCGAKKRKKSTNQETWKTAYLIYFFLDSLFGYCWTFSPIPFEIPHTLSLKPPFFRIIYTPRKLDR